MKPFMVSLVELIAKNKSKLLKCQDKETMIKELVKMEIELSEKCDKEEFEQYKGLFEPYE